MTHLQKYYEGLTTAQLQAERFTIQNKIEEGLATDNSVDLCCNMDKRGTIDTILKNRYSGDV